MIDLETANLHRQVELTLNQAKDVLYKIDSVIDKLEGKGVHSAFIELQDLLIEWDLLGHNFASLGIQDWIESDE